VSALAVDRDKVWPHREVGAATTPITGLS